VHRFPDDFEIGDKVRLSSAGLDRKVHQPFRHKPVTGHDEHGCVLVDVAKSGAKRPRIRPFDPEFLEKELP